jgi:hypothetical protein
VLATSQPLELLTRQALQSRVIQQEKVRADVIIEHQALRYAVQESNGVKVVCVAPAVEHPPVPKDWKQQARRKKCHGSHRLQA